MTVDRNFALLFTARALRMFAYGSVGVVLAVFLNQVRHNG